MCKAGTTDGTTFHAWFFENETANDGQGALTTDGVENIANHKYKPGHYTFMDTLLNPFWTFITDLLPMTMAPNVVTSIGGLHCLLSYLVVWHYSPNFDQLVPDWVILFSGYCTLAYYTFDCMDGKQARRTGNSSPLGQLFDHGVDCLAIISHVSGTAAYTMMGGSYWFLMMQASLQLSFFMAQWEEYYTGILPHAMGEFGVTELNYGIGFFLIFNSLIDREKFWLSAVKDVIIPESMVGNPNIPDVLANLEMRQFGLILWFMSLSILIVSCIGRVLFHENVRKNGVYLSAISKLFSPAIISLVPFLLPESILFKETRHISISIGLLYCLLTKKMIVYSMAKMTYASFQFEIVPLCAVIAWIRLDGNITEEGVSLLLSILSIWYVYRMLNWVSNAIHQICKRLDIKCFKIQNKGDKKIIKTN